MNPYFVPPVPPAIIQRAHLSAHKLEFAVFLSKLGMVETGGKWTKVGKKGELGAYQMRRITWYSLTTQPFRLAKDPNVAPAIAAKYLRRICAALRRVGLPPTAYYMALTWKEGIRNVRDGTYGPKAVDFADRVQNLYDEKP